MNALTKTLLAGAVALAVAAPAVAQQKNYKMATIAPGTSAYLAMTTMATLVNQSLPEVNIQVDATGAATQHMVEVARGNLDFCMTSPTIYTFMKNKTAMYKELPNAPELADKLRLVYWFPLGEYHFVTYADSGIETPADFKGKKVFLGPPGGGAYAAAVQVLGYMAGYKDGVDYEPVNASWASALQGFQDHQFDVYTTTGIAPFPQLEQLALTSKLRLIGLSKDEYEANKPMQDFINGTTGEELGIIKAGVYGDGVVNTGDVYTLAAWVGVAVRADMDEDTVYKVTKAYWDAAKGATASHPWLAGITLDGAVADGGMKLHPGALKYYKEIGVSVPEGSM